MRRPKSPDAAGIAEAAEWRLLGLLLERPRAGWREEIAALGREVRDGRLRAVVAAAREATEGEYLRLLGPGGAVSPREVTYRSFEDPGQVLADLAGFYEAFAFTPRVEEPIDHVAVEVGFVGYLWLKEAFARTGGDDTAAKTIAAARHQFLATHLAAVVGPFTQRLEAMAPSHVLAAAQLIAARVPMSAAVSPAPDLAALPGACGSCSLSTSS